MWMSRASHSAEMRVSLGSKELRSRFIALGHGWRTWVDDACRLGDAARAWGSFRSHVQCRLLLALPDCDVSRDYGAYETDSAETW